LSEKLHNISSNDVVINKLGSSILSKDLLHDIEIVADEE
jgi:hypothetical protein